MAAATKQNGRNREVTKTTNVIAVNENYLSHKLPVSVSQYVEVTIKQRKQRLDKYKVETKERHVSALEQR